MRARTSQRGRRIRPWHPLLAALAGLALGAAPAIADGTPSISETVSSSTALYGENAHVAVTAANATSTYGYNLSVRVVLPAGVSYAGGSPVAPVQYANQPATGQTTLVFGNVSDLSPGSSFPIAFDLAYSQTAFDAGGSFAVTAQSFVDANPRFVPKFSATGAPVAGSTSYTGFTQPVSGTQTLVAIQVQKHEPSPEGEIVRGVHDHQTTYTVTVRNNDVHPTTGTVLDDWLPAGLEFLGCGGGIDHTTNAPTNPGSSREYPGAPSITVQPVAGCVLPDSVETVRADPDGPLGPLPEAVYTHVRWDVGTLTPGQVLTFPYRAAVPLRANTTTWSGDEPSPASLDQSVNLDNNGGPEVTDETPLANLATVAGTYQTATPTATSASATLTRTAEDWVVHEAGSSAALAQQGLTTWTLQLQTGEYKWVSGATVTDTLPNGLCPLGPANLTSRNDAADAECAPVSGVGPSSPYASAVEHADGTWTLTWTPATDPALQHTGVNATFAITFSTRTRQSYQASFLPSAPLLSNDALQNAVTTQGQGFARCTAPGTPDCTTPGPRIGFDGSDGAAIADASGAGQVAPGPSIQKLVAASGTDCRAASYVSAIPHYHPGDRICWEVRVDFPSSLDTVPQRLADSLPAGVLYEKGSEVSLPANDVTGAVDESGSADGLLTWSVTGGHVAAGGHHVVRAFSTIARPVGQIVQGDVQGNLLKFASTNTPGVSTPLRAQAQYAIDSPVLSLTKGVQSVGRAGQTVAGPFGPNVDNQAVEQGDRVTFRVDVTNSGAQDAVNVDVRDVLPPEFRCPITPSDGGTCTAATANDTLRWTLASLPAGQSRELTFSVLVPAVIGPSRTLTNRAGVRQFQSVTNLGGLYTYTPASNIDPTDKTAPNVPRADDASAVLTRNVTVAKTRTTSVSEAGNDASSQATIGETISYAIVVTIPEGTTLGSNPVLTDTLDAAARQPYVAGSATATLNGAPLPAGWALDTSGPTPKVTGPASYANASGSGDDLVRLTFRTTVADVAANTRTSASLTNLSTFGWTDPVIGAQTRVSAAVATAIVEPLLTQRKTDDRSPARVLPGDIVAYTVTTSDTGTRVSTAHDATITDHVPAGITPVGPAPANAPLGDGAAVPGATGATWHAVSRTITRTVASINAGASASYTYRVRVDSPAIAGTRVTNTADATGASLAATAAGRRTGYTADASDTIVVGIAAIAKTVSPPSATIGDPLTYHVDVTLPPNLVLYDVTVKDLVPDDVDVDGYASAVCVSGCPLVHPVQTYTPAPGPIGTTVVAWSLGDITTPLATAQVIRLEYRAHVRALHRSGGALVIDRQTAVNSATVSSDRTDQKGFDATSIPASFDDDSVPATATTTVAEPRVGIDKKVAVGAGAFTDGPATAHASDGLSYELVVTNGGDAPAYDVQVTDLPDAELTDVVPATVAGAVLTDGWSAASPSLGWTIPGPIAPHASVTLAYTASLVRASGLHDGETVDNTARVPHFFGVPVATRLANPAFVYRDYTDGGSDATRVVLDFPRLALAKTTGLIGSPDTGTAQIGQDFAWRIVVTNSSATAGVRAVDVRDTLPPNWTYSGHGLVTPGGASDPAINAAATGDTLDWVVPAIGPGQTVAITYTARPAPAAETTPGLAPQANVNAARVVSATDDAGDTGTADGPFSTPPDTATASLVAPGLTIQKTPDLGAATAGTASSFTITVGNGGTGTARNVDVADVLPAGIGYTAGAATATPATGFGETAPIAGPTPGETTVQWQVASLAPGASVTIHVPVSVAASVPAGTTLTNSASVISDEEPMPVGDTGSLDVAASADMAIDKAGAPTYTAGSQYTWHLRVRNLGPSDAQAVTVTDPLPPGAALVSADAPCAGAGGTVTCAIGTAAAGFDHSYDVLVQVDPAVTAATLDNTATVATTTPDPVAANDASTFGPAAAPLADVSVLKTADPVAVLRGHPTVFTITVGNGGPSVARGVQLVDTLPAGLAFASSDLAGCVTSGSAMTCAIGDLAPGATVVAHVIATGVQDGTWANTATVTTTTPEPATGALPDTSSAQVDVGPVADLALLKSAPASVPAGGQISYSLAVTDNGPDDATGVAISDPLPPGTAFVSADPGCTAAAGLVTCAIGPLAAGASTARGVTVSVPLALAGTTVVNTASVHGDQGDDHPENDTSSASTAVQPAADLALAKSGPATATAGTSVTWTLSVANDGPSASSGATVVDTLPAGVTYVSSTTSQGACTASGQTVTCAFGPLASGAGAQAQITAALAPALADTTVINTGLVQGGDPDPNPSNNGASTSTAVTPPASATTAGGGSATPGGGASTAGGKSPKAVLRIRKTTRQPVPVEAGARVAYTIVVKDVSKKTAAKRVTVCDALPAPLVFVSAAGAHFRAGRACWSIAKLGAGRARTFRVVTRVTGGARAGTVRNTATATAANAAAKRATATVRVRTERLSHLRGGGVTG